MMTTHAADLLLSKLPPEARLAHQLPALSTIFSPLPSCATQAARYFFKKQVAKSPSMGKSSCEGGTTPKIAFVKS
jgi:hypothetical protein